MDGFGVRAEEAQPDCRLRLAGDSLAGSPFSGKLAGGTCARVMTGGLIPDGADAVVPVECTSGYEPQDDGCIEFRENTQVGANIRRRGSVRAAGDSLIEAGTRLAPAHLGILAQQGMVDAEVGVRPRVAVVPTGDEIVAIGATPGPGQVRNSNAHALVAQIAAAGGEPALLDILRDREGETEARLAAALREYDLVCTIGGVSMGTRDLVRPTFAALGGQTLVESVRIKPGKPTLFGTVELGGHRSTLLGLPGNPASSFTIFALFGVPWVLAFQGAARPRWVRARLAGAKLRANRRLQALPGRWVRTDGSCVIEAIEQRSSADLFCLGEADALFLVPENDLLVNGAIVDCVPLS